MVLCTDEWGKNVSQHISGLKAVSGFAAQLYWDKIWPRAETLSNCHFAIQMLALVSMEEDGCMALSLWTLCPPHRDYWLMGRGCGESMMSLCRKMSVIWKDEKVHLLI